MPIPDEVLPQVRTEVSPSAGLSEVATPDAFGANVGEALMQHGDVQTRLYHDANAAAVTRAHNEVDDHSNASLYDRKTGLLYQNLGEQAPAAVDKAAEDYAAHVSEVRGKLTNDAQRAMFDSSMGEHGRQFSRVIGDYEHRQVTEGQNANTKAYIENRQNDIAQNYDKPDLVNAAIAQQRYALVQAYARNTGGDPVTLAQAVDAGKEPEALKDILARRTSDAHMTALSAMQANGQNQMAKAYFEAHKQDFTAQDLIRAASTVKAGSDMDEARALEASIVAKQHADNRDGGIEDTSAVSQEAALKDLEERNVTDTKIHDLAQARIVHHFQLMGSAHKEAQGQLLEQAAQSLDDPKNTSYEIPANVYGQLDLKGREAVDKRKTQLQKFGRVDTDEDVKYRLNSMAKDPEQWDEFLAEPKETFHGSLNNVDWNKYLQTRAYIEGQSKRRDAKLSQFMVSAKLSSDLFRENDLPLPDPKQAGTPAYKAAADMHNRFNAQLDSAVRAESLKLKPPRELTEDEIRPIAAKLFTQTTWQSAPASFWDRLGSTENRGLLSSPGNGLRQESGPAFTAPNADKFAYRVEDIPPDALKVMQKHDNASGVRRSKDKLVSDYNERLSQAYNLSLAKP